MNKKRVPKLNHEEMVKETAYFLAEKRGFIPGYELEDWIEAERLVASSQKSPPAKKAAARRNVKRGRPISVPDATPLN